MQEMQHSCVYITGIGWTQSGCPEVLNFCSRFATNRARIRPQTLPPTSAAARYHSMRVYIQVQQWMGICYLKETEWVDGEGWKSTHDDRPTALTEDLLRIIRCNCTTDCSTARCSCRKHNLECSPACGQCRGVGCCNSSVADSSEDDDDDI